MVSFDESQENVRQRLQRGRHMAVVGAPGTGRSFLLTSLVIDILRQDPSARVALLSPDRRAASQLHEELSAQLGTMRENLSVRSLPAFAFSIMHSYAQEMLRDTPELISGPVEDLILQEILEDERSDITFPRGISEKARYLPSFRQQIRNLITRAQEFSLTPSQLSSYAQQYGLALWDVAAQVWEHYRFVLASRDALGGGQTPDRLDHAQLLHSASHALLSWGEFDDVPRLGIPCPSWDWVLVDDLHNAPHSALKLLDALAQGGATVIVAGDPDSAVQGFRGGASSNIGVFLSGNRDSEVHYLRFRHRGGGILGNLANQVTQNISVGSGLIGQRKPSDMPSVSGTSLVARSFATKNEQARYLAQHIRHLCLVGAPSQKALDSSGSAGSDDTCERLTYGDCAIITRSRSEHSIIREALSQAGIPVAREVSSTPLRDHPLVIALFNVLTKIYELPLQLRIPLQYETIMASPFFDLPGEVIYRELRLLRAVRKIRGRVSEGAQSLESILNSEFDDEEAQLVPVIAGFATTLKKLRLEHSGKYLSAESTLWGFWEATQRATLWQNRVIENHDEQADEYLDVMLQLFRVLRRMTERDPDLSLRSFIESIETQSLPEDTIIYSKSVQNAVTLTTPSSSIGLSWKHVIIPSIQENLWPDLRLRDALAKTFLLESLVATPLIDGDSAVDEHRGAIKDVSHEMAQREVFNDELKMFHHSITRAQESLLLTCVENSEERPSHFFELCGFQLLHTSAENPDVVQDAQEKAFIRYSVQAVPPAITKSDLIGQLRRALRDNVDASVEQREKAQELLTRLAHAGIKEAQRENWLDAYTPYTWDECVEADGDVVRLSPSSLEKLLQCPLKASLQSFGFERLDRREAIDLGNFIHELAELYPYGNEEEILQAFAEKWKEQFGDVSEDYSSQFRYWRAHRLAQGLASYLAEENSLEPREEHTQVEVPLHYSDTTRGVALSARIDRIIRNKEGKTVIVDFKTGSTPSQKSMEENLQLLVYQWLYEQSKEGQRSDGGAYLVALKEPKKSGGVTLKTQNPLNDEKFEYLMSILEEVAEIKRSSTIYATPGAHCRGCVFTSLCPTKNEGKLFS